MSEHFQSDLERLKERSILNNLARRCAIRLCWDYAGLTHDEIAVLVRMTSSNSVAQTIRRTKTHDVQTLKILKHQISHKSTADPPVAIRNLWENIRKDMPTKGRGKGEELDPLKLPTRFQTALQSLYGHYEKTFKLWEGKGIKVPPCFILVCQNTAISKLVYDFISGFHRRHGCYWRLEEILGKLRRPFYDVVR